MKITIVGTGGTGGVAGAYLALAGHDVTFIARGRHLAAIRENGLTVRTAHRGDIHVRPAHACTMEEYIDSRDAPDVMFVCVKYYGLDDAIALAQHTASPDTLIIPILNVYGTGEVMQERLPGLCCLDGCIYVFAKIGAPGVIEQPEKILRIFFGFRPGQDARLRPRAEALGQALKEAGIGGRLSDNIRRDALQKFAFVSPMGAAGLYYDAVSDDFQREGPVREMFLALIGEVAAIGAALGLSFENDLRATGLKLMDAFQPGLRTSMQRDVLGGGPSEFDGLVNRVVALGQKLGVPTPCYEKISRWGREKGIGQAALTASATNPETS